MHMSSVYLAFTVVLSSMVNCSPLPKTQSVLDLIRDLKPKCHDNSLLNETTNVQLYQCNTSKLMDTKIGLSCVSFLDINRRLCAVRSVAHLNWTEFRPEEYKDSTPEEICDSSNVINFGEVPEYPKYKMIMEKVFTTKEPCLKLCMGEDSNVLDVSANYFCKVLLYGSKFLKTQASLSNTTNNDANTTLNITTALNHINSSIPVTSEKTSAVISPDAVVPVYSAPSATNIKIETSLQTTSTQQNPSKPVSDKVKLKIKPETSGDKAETSEHKPPTADNENNNVVIPTGSTKTNSQSILDSNVYKLSGVAEEDKEDEDSDYNENEGDDKTFDTNSQQEIKTVKIEVTSSKKSHKLEDYTPMMPTYDDEDESSFFPMFFFVICTIVLLYIFYHNKNKIMGLLIEGRQANNRRRTSRGHAYKKLDTLEQAISSNDPGVTTSKIIY